jgi:peptidoglycan/xylan/chitin deacetylase (PgdA/CDA1 family)
VAASTSEGTRIINLCFHGIGEPERSLEPDEEKFWITEDQFSEMLDVVAQNPATRITFDDGNASDANIAFPTLVKRGLTATFFIIADRLDQAGSVTSADVRSMADAGMQVGSHGKAHLPWRSVGDAELQSELVDAADTIASVSGQPVRKVACPFGDYDRRVLGAVKRSNFERVYTVDGGAARCGAWLQPRNTVRFDNTPADIERLVREPGGDTVGSLVRTGKGLIKRWR